MSSYHYSSSSLTIPDIEGRVTDKPSGIRFVGCGSVNRLLKLRLLRDASYAPWIRYLTTLLCNYAGLNPADDLVCCGDHGGAPTMGRSNEFLLEANVCFTSCSVAATRQRIVEDAIRNAYTEYNARRGKAKDESSVQSHTNQIFFVYYNTVAALRLLTSAIRELECPDDVGNLPDDLDGIPAILSHRIHGALISVINFPIEILREVARPVLTPTTST